METQLPDKEPLIIRETEKDIWFAQIVGKNTEGGYVNYIIKIFRNFI